LRVDLQGSPRLATAHRSCEAGRVAVSGGLGVQLRPRRAAVQVSERGCHRRLGDRTARGQPQLLIHEGLEEPTGLARRDGNEVGKFLSR
jgi:hypothetical protein